MTKQERPIPLTYLKRRRRSPAWSLDWMVLAALMFLAMLAAMVGSALFKGWW